MEGQKSERGSKFMFIFYCTTTRQAPIYWWTIFVLLQLNVITTDLVFLISTFQLHNEFVKLLVLNCSPILYNLKSTWMWMRTFFFIPSWIYVFKIQSRVFFIYRLTCGKGCWLQKGVHFRSLLNFEYLPQKCNIPGLSAVNPFSLLNFLSTFYCVPSNKGKQWFTKEKENISAIAK